MKVSDIVAVPFEWGSALRGKRFFHPLGVLAEGAVERVAPAGEGLPLPSGAAVVRVSKATGTPAALPDLIGLAIRVTPPQATTPWDTLLVSAGSGVLSRAVALRPVTSWTGHAMTTLMPLHYGGRNWWLRGRMVTDIGGAGLSLAGIRNAIARGGIEVELDQARGSGEFTPLGRLTMTRVLDAERGEDVSFDPVLNTAPGLRLHPWWLAGLRAHAYQRSRRGRDAD